MTRALGPGARLRRESLAVRFRDRSIAALAHLPVADALRWFNRLRLAGREAAIARDSGWAPAWAGLAESMALYPFYAGGGSAAPRSGTSRPGAGPRPEPSRTSNSASSHPPYRTLLSSISPGSLWKRPTQSELEERRTLPVSSVFCSASVRRGSV